MLFLQFCYGKKLHCAIQVYKQMGDGGRQAMSYVDQKDGDQPLRFVSPFHKNSYNAGIYGGRGIGLFIKIPSLDQIYEAIKKVFEFVYTFHDAVASSAYILW
jgi:hypothetical protein